jgi:cleavage and polyadenylation specificity factor subunit 2
MYSKVPLQGLELEEYLQKERAEKEKEAAQKVANARSQMLLEADEDDDESDDSDNDDSDEENEVERALDGDSMDTAEDHPPDGVVVRKKKGGGGGGGRGGGDDWGGLDAGEDGLSKHLSFDIFLKGNVSKATSFFKTADGQTQRFRMFPYIEKKRRVDEYGETIDVGMWLRTSKAFEEADDEDNKDKKRNVEDDTKVCLGNPSPRFCTNSSFAEGYSRGSFKIRYLGHRSSISLSTIIR